MNVFIRFVLIIVVENEQKMGGKYLKAHFEPYGHPNFLNIVQFPLNSHNKFLELFFK